MTFEARPSTTITEEWEVVEHRGDGVVDFIATGNAEQQAKLIAWALQAQSDGNRLYRSYGPRSNNIVAFDFDQQEG